MAYNRNEALTLDKACGMTFAQLAAKYKIHTSRAEQIFTQTLRRMGLDRTASAAEVGLMVQRRRAGYIYHGDTNTPQGFYWAGCLRSAD